MKYQTYHHWYEDVIGAGDLIDMSENCLALTLVSEDIQNINTLIDREFDVEYKPQN